MNRAPELIFTPEGDVFLATGATVSGFNASTQHALVNLLSRRGQDPLFPDRGTTIVSRALAGVLIDNRAAEHEANFAAADTLFFGREHDVAASSDKLADLRLEIITLNTLQLDLAATFVSVDGRVLSFPLTNASN